MSYFLQYDTSFVSIISENPGAAVHLNQNQFSIILMSQIRDPRAWITQFIWNNKDILYKK